MIDKIIRILPKPLQKIYYKRESVWLYLIFGGLTTVVSVLTHYAADYSGANTLLATAISWVCSVTFAFFTNKKYVFKSEANGKTDFFAQAGKFYGGRLTTFLLEYGFLAVTTDILGFNTHVMKIIAQIFILVGNYFISKFIVFGKKRDSNF